MSFSRKSIKIPEGSRTEQFFADHVLSDFSHMAKHAFFDGPNLTKNARAHYLVISMTVHHFWSSVGVDIDKLVEFGQRGGRGGRGGRAGERVERAG